MEDAYHQVEVVICSMCGDVGIPELLFLCSKCSLRPQHIYCSRSYPNLCRDASVCDWCLHEEESSSSNAVKSSNVPDDTDACAKAGEATAHTNGNATCLVEELNYPAAADIVNEDDTHEGSVKKSHGKAFEYLLLIAAQSLSQAINGADGEIKRSNHTNREIKRVNHTNREINVIVGSKADYESDKIVKSGSTDRKKIMGSADNEASSGNNGRLMTNLDSNQRMEQVKCTENVQRLEEKANIVYAGSSILKRQRYSKGPNAMLKCRKKGLQLSPTRPNYRRYKLLADVVC